jgi:hypothetical protein
MWIVLYSPARPERGTVKEFQVMKWFRDHVLTWGYIRDLMLTVDLDRLNVIIDRLIVISPGTVVMKIDSKVCFPRRPSGSNT